LFDTQGPFSYTCPYPKGIFRAYKQPMPRYRMVSKGELSMPKLMVIEKDAVVFESLYLHEYGGKKPVEPTACMNHYDIIRATRNG